jgi:hypothetical protein
MVVSTATKASTALRRDMIVHVYHLTKVSMGCAFVPIHTSCRVTHRVPIAFVWRTKVPVCMYWINQAISATTVRMDALAMIWVVTPAHKRALGK